MEKVTLHICVHQSDAAMFMSSDNCLLSIKPEPHSTDETDQMISPQKLLFSPTYEKLGFLKQSFEWLL